MIGFTVDLNAGWEFDVAAIIVLGVPTLLALVGLRLLALVDERRRSRRSRRMASTAVRRYRREEAELDAMLAEAEYRRDLREPVSS